MNTDRFAFAAFESLTRSAFDFLVSSYGFRFVGTNSDGPECWAVYESTNTRVTIAFELGLGPRVELERKKLRWFGRRER